MGFTAFDFTAFDAPMNAGMFPIPVRTNDVDVSGPPVEWLDPDARWEHDIGGEAADALAAAYARCAGHEAPSPTHGPVMHPGQGDDDSRTFRVAMAIHRRLCDAVTCRLEREQAESFTAEELRRMLLDGLPYPDVTPGADQVARIAEASVRLALAFGDVDMPRVLRVEPDFMVNHDDPHLSGLSARPSMEVRGQTCLALMDTALILGPRMDGHPAFRYALRAMAEELLSTGCGSGIIMPAGMTLESAMRTVADDRDRLEADAPTIARAMLADEPICNDDGMPYEMVRQDVLQIIGHVRTARTDGERWPEPTPHGTGDGSASGADPSGEVRRPRCPGRGQRKEVTDGEPAVQA